VLVAGITPNSMGMVLPNLLTRISKIYMVVTCQIKCERGIRYCIVPFKCDSGSASN